MKHLLLVTLTLGLGSIANANSAGSACVIGKGPGVVVISSTSPTYSGESRYFERFEYYSKGLSDQAQPDLTIDKANTNYQVSYADGTLSNGAPYERLEIRDRNGNGRYYSITVNKTKKTKAVSEISSNLSALNIPYATLNCDVP